MKWRNIPKKERRANWVTAEAPHDDRVKDAHKWCVDYESTGGFYYHYTNTRWWFEFEEDAIIFALTVV